MVFWSVLEKKTKKSGASSFNLKLCILCFGGFISFLRLPISWCRYRRCCCLCFFSRGDGGGAICMRTCVCIVCVCERRNLMTQHRQTDGYATYTMLPTLALLKFVSFFFGGIWNFSPRLWPQFGDVWDCAQPNLGVAVAEHVPWCTLWGVPPGGRWRRGLSQPRVLSPWARAHLGWSAWCRDVYFLPEQILRVCRYSCSCTSEEDNHYVAYLPPLHDAVGLLLVVCWDVARRIVVVHVGQLVNPHLHVHVLPCHVAQD